MLSPQHATSISVEKPDLQPLLDLTDTEMQSVNQMIMANMHSDIALIPQLAGHIVAAGGKRMRPMLTVATAALCGYQGTRHHLLAACVEFIHTATLLHDDVVDGSDLRRGQASANAVWGNKSSVLVGDFLFSRAFNLMVADGDLKVLQILSSASATIAEGEVGQLMTSNNLAATEDEYLDVIRAKTAALFAAATRVGAVVARQGPAQEAALDAFGMHLGMAFQLMDDALDYDAQRAELGKNVGDDFAEGKMTLPVILALQQATPDEYAFWERTMERVDQQDGDLAAAQQLLAKYGTLDATRQRANDYALAAVETLDGFADSPMKSALIQAALFAGSRRY